MRPLMLCFTLSTALSCNGDLSKLSSHSKDHRAAKIDRSAANQQLVAGYCSDQGRLFPPGSLPSLDGCNPCQCTCKERNSTAECHINCSQQGCLPTPKLPQPGVSQVYDDIGREFIYSGLSCPEQKICAFDLYYVQACQRHGGLAVDNGCCNYHCTAKVIREPSPASLEPSACEAAKTAFASLVTELTTVVQNQGGQRYIQPRLHSCQSAADCLVVPLSGESCGNQGVVSSAAYQPLAVRFSEQVSAIHTYCPKFSGDCPKTQTALDADCVRGICTRKE